MKKKADKDESGKKEGSVSNKSESKRNVRKEIRDLGANPSKSKSQEKRKASPKKRVSRVSRPKKKSPMRAGSRDHEINIDSRKFRKSGPKTKELSAKNYKTSNPLRSKFPKRNPPSIKCSKFHHSYKSILTIPHRSNRSPLPHPPPNHTPNPPPHPKLRRHTRRRGSSSNPRHNPTPKPPNRRLRSSSSSKSTPSLGKKITKSKKNPKTPNKTDKEWFLGLEQNLQIKVLSLRAEDDFLQKREWKTIERQTGSRTAIDWQLEETRLD